MLEQVHEYYNRKLLIFANTCSSCLGIKMEKSMFVGNLIVIINDVRLVEYLNGSK